MVDRRYETKERKVVERTLIEKRYCDICRKEITGHYDWGNDSCASIENLDVCSVECLNTVFDNYRKRWELILFILIVSMRGTLE